MRLKDIQLSRFWPRPVHATAEAVGVKLGELRVGQAGRQSDSTSAAQPNSVHATAQAAGASVDVRRMRPSWGVQAGPQKLTIQKAGHSPVPAASAGSGCAC